MKTELECPYGPDEIEIIIAGLENFDPSKDNVAWGVIADCQTARNAVRGLKVASPMSAGAQWFLQGMIRQLESGQPVP